MPEAVGYRGQLEHLLRDPDMAALIAAAPEPMGRALRPLCRMLGLPPPPILAPPRPAPAASAAAEPEKPRPPWPHRREQEEPLRGAPSPVASPHPRGPPRPRPA
jgi:hypothetical protein